MCESILDNQKVVIAMIRIKADISASGKIYRGPILFNPGVFAYGVTLISVRVQISGLRLWSLNDQFMGKLLQKVLGDG